MLYHQIADSVLKAMRKVKVYNLYDFLSEFEFSKKAADYMPKSLNFEVHNSIAQRKMVNLGKAIARIMSMEFVIDLGGNGFRNDLINNCLETLQAEVEGILSNYHLEKEVDIVIDYKGESSWLKCLLPVCICIKPLLFSAEEK